MCPIEELPPGGVRIVREGDLEIGVFNLGGRLCAIEDRCSHDDGPLGQGFLHGDAIGCPRHGATFDLATGRALSMPAVTPIRTFPVKAEAGSVFVGVQAD